MGEDSLSTHSLEVRSVGGGGRAFAGGYGYQRLQPSQVVVAIDRPLLLLVLLLLVMVTGIHRPLMLLALGVVSANPRPLMLLCLLVLLDLELVLVLIVMLLLVLNLFLLLLLLLLRGVLLFSNREPAERRDVGMNHSINVCCAGILR